MPEDKKKKDKKFFRINTQGEISETTRQTSDTNPGIEPNRLSEENPEQLKDSPTEISHEETFAESQNQEQESLKPESDDESRQEEPHFEIKAEDEELQESFLTEISSSNLVAQDVSNLDSMIPSSSPMSPSSENVETLRNYISLKEKEVSDLKEQQRQYQNVLLKLKRSQEDLNRINLELQRDLDTAKSSESLLKKEVHTLREKHESEIAILKNDFEQQKLQSGSFEEQLAELTRQKTVWKDKISDDLKKIKLKEKELENKYELLKKDTETLLDSKDQQILEFRKKNDALELELESLEERLLNEHAILNSIESKKRRLIETLKLAISLLEQIDTQNDVNDARKTG